MSDGQNVSRLSDRLAIQDVMAEYARLLDERDDDGYRALFVEDLLIHGFGGARLDGVDAWVGFVTKTADRYSKTQHMLGPPTATIDGDSARVRTDLRAIHIPKTDPAGIFTVWGTYHTVMTRTRDGWKIAEHELRVTHVHDLKPGE